MNANAEIARYRRVGVPSIPAAIKNTNQITEHNQMKGKNIVSLVEFAEFQCRQHNKPIPDISTVFIGGFPPSTLGVEPCKQ